MQALDNFCGDWVLLPDKCEYQVGEPPRQGSYQISRELNQVFFHLHWQDSAGEMHQMSYSEFCDSEYHPFMGSDAVDEICLRLTNDSLLESFSRHHGQMVMAASRELVSPELLKVIMKNYLADGSEKVNTAFYQKRQLESF